MAQGSNSRSLPTKAKLGASNPSCAFTEEDTRQSIAARFERVAARYGSRLAVQAGDERLTYAKLNRAGNRIARALLAKRGEGERPVALLFKQGAAMVKGSLAALKAGKIYAPLDYSMPLDRARAILKDSQADLIVTDRENVFFAREIIEDRKKILNIDELDSDLADRNPHLSIASTRPAFIHYTSGSTGAPKGVVGGHRNELVNIRLKTRALHVTPEDRISLLRSNNVGATSDMLLGLLNGAAVVPLELKEEGLARLADWLVEQQITLFTCVATVYRHCVRSLSGRERFPRLRMIHLGGEPVLESDVALYKKYFSDDCLLAIRLGISETKTATYYFFSKSTPVHDGVVPVGHPLDGYEIEILDAAGEQVGSNIVGEIAVKSAYLAEGYWRQPELTRAKFLPDPESGDRRIYRTGDLGYLTQDGCLVHTGRKDSQVKIRGYRVEIAEIEKALLDFPDVMHASVLPGEEGPERKRLAAYIVARPDCRLSMAKLRVFLERKLPSYMVPVSFAILPSLPLTSSGKIDRRALPPPEKCRREIAAPYVAPKTAVEKFLRQLWTEVLGVAEIGVHDSFPQLGGDSLLGARIVARVNDSFALERPLKTLFETPSVADLAAFLLVQERSPGESERIAAILLKVEAPCPRTTYARRLQRRKARGAMPNGPSSNPADDGRQAAKRELALTLLKKEGLARPAAQGILPRQDFGAAPLSFAQERLWFLDQVQPGNSVYNICRAYRLTGPLDAALLTRALNSVVRRHEILHTLFPAVGGSPVQQIVGPSESSIASIDLRHLTNGVRQAEAFRIVQEQAEVKFNLADGPVWHVKLIRIAKARHVLVFTVHQILFDGGSLGLFFREIEALYKSFCSGRPVELPDLPVQYADFSVWQRAWLQGDQLEKQLDYWKKRLDGTLPALELPVDRSRPAVQSFRGARHGFVLRKSLTGALKQLSREEGVTLFATLMTAFNVLLYRYAGQQDIIVGFPIANRDRPEIQNLLGSFVNTLALRTDLSGDPAFRALLARVSRACVDGYAHQDLPFERLVDELGQERDLSRNPIFQVMFAFHNTQPAGLRLPGIRVEDRVLHGATSKFDLTLSLGEEDDRLVGFFEYSTDLFERPTIVRMAGHLKTLLRGVVADRDRTISTLPLLTEAERRQILVHWNDTAAGFSRNQCVHQLFEAQAKRTPEAVAVEQGGERLTYRELNRRANQLSRYLRKLGAGPEKLVAVCLDRSLEMVIGLLGVLKSGAAYLPLDPKYPLERLAFMLADTRAGVLLTQKRFAGGTESPLANRLLSNGNLKVVCLDIERKRIGRENPRRFSSVVRSHHLAYVIYTSGSTGQPKGVAIEHRNAASFLDWAKGVFSPAELSGVLASTSICFDLSIFELFAPLCAGGKVILVQDAFALVDLRERTDITLINTVPSAMHALLAEGGLPRSVRTVNLAGEPLKSELVQQIYATGAVEKVYDLYGPSETTSYSTFTLRAPTGRASIGRPIANTQIYLLDAAFQPVPIGVPGELFIGGAGVARGYLHRPELTAEKFLRDPFVKRRRARLYRTGDLARYFADGNIEYLGRADNQVKIRGYRIELGEIEAVLAQHPAVREVVVVARELNGAQPARPSNTKLEKQLIAYLVLKDCELPPAELQNFLRAKVPEFMLPAMFLPIAALPLTPNGKVDRRGLPTPNVDAGRAASEFVAPRNEIEELIAQVWREILGIEQIGVSDNFFALGGHSLLATKLILRLRAAFGIDLPLRKLFDSPTVAELARAIATLRRDRSCVLLPPLTAAPCTDTAPLSFSQRRLWFLHKLEPDLTAYNMPAAYRIEGPLKIAFFERALDAIVQRHETLRSAIVEIDGEPQQRIAPQAQLNLPIIDLTHLTPEQADREVERLANEDVRRPFDLAAAPLLRAAILRLAGDVHVLLVNFHHIICDGSSLAVFYRELAALYGLLLQGREPVLPPLALQYRDFAAWQQQSLRHGGLQPQLDYWRGHLGGRLTPIDLPSDWPRPAVQNYRGARVTVRLSRRLTAALKQLAGKEQVTLFMILLTSLKILLLRLTGQTQIVVGSTVAGRNRAELEGLIGFFINAVALRSDLSGNPVFVELLKRVREVCIDAYTHQDLPFERVVEELNPQRDLSRNPIFQVLFNMAEIAERELQLPGCTTTRVSRAAAGAKFDLVVHAPQIDGAIELALVYNAELFAESRMRAMLEAWNHLLSQIVAGPAGRIGEFSLVGEATKALLPNPAEPLDDQWRAPIHSWIAAQAKARPDKQAIIDDRESWSYRELDRLSNQLAHHLIGRGIRQKDVVAIYAHRDASLALGLLGVLKAGGVFVILDPAYPSARLVEYLRVAQPNGFVEMEGAGQLPAEIEAYLGKVEIAARVKLPRAKTQIVRRFARSPRSTPDVAIAADDPAYIAFTSGSTGEPKGVLCRHGPITHFLPWQTQTFDLSAADRYALLSGLGYNHLHRDLFTALALGATLCVPSDDDLKDPSRFARWLDRHEVSILHLTPALGRFLQTSKRKILPAVRRMFFGGDLLLRQDILTMRALAPNAQFTSFYGATETQRAVGYFIVPDALLDARQRARWAIPTGKGAPGVQLLLLTQAGQLAGIGEVGELYVRSPHLAAGYVGNSSLSEMNFITNPFSGDPRDRLYRTRELGRYLPDGNVEWLGRNQRRASIRGFCVELAEVEAALGQCPGVREAAVVAREFPLEPATNETRLVAYVVRDRDGATDATGLRKFLHAKLPGPMVPAYFHFVERMPINPNGKIDYDALPGGEQRKIRAESAFSEPRNEIERVVGKVLADVLQIARIGRSDNFFELGGHSLLAARAAARLRETLGLEVDLRDFLELPTVEGICRRLEAQDDDRLPIELGREEIEL